MVIEQRVDSFYAKLRESAYSSSSSRCVLIFPSTSDVDSLCALRIIFHILETDGLRYACYPVSSFDEIRKYVDLSRSNDQPMVLINWGCHWALRRTLPNARIFVMDSHRPIHLDNLSDQNDAVTVLFTQDDENQAKLAYGFEFPLTALANATTSLDSDDDDQEQENSSRKRNSEQDDEEQKQELYRKGKETYYRFGTFHGKSSGFLMFELAHLLPNTTKTTTNYNEWLWFACVGLTDQLVHARISDERYLDGVRELQQSGNLDTTSVILNDGTITGGRDASRIVHGDELKLVLLQEWNLFDSMQCSPYIATKLETWSVDGMGRLRLLLADMGFALRDCQQQFEYMDIRIKRKMKSEFDIFLAKSGLHDFYYRGFLRIDGYRYRVSAADVVYGVTALLESFSKGSSASSQFGDAYDALSVSHLDTLKKGMKRAVTIQKLIFQRGSTAITRDGSIRCMRKFSWLTLDDRWDANLLLLGYPQALTKLCHFLMDALRTRGQSKEHFVCSCLSQEPGKVLVVGVCGRPHLAAAQGNALGITFRTVAEDIGIEFLHELFESSWIILDASAVFPFMHRLDLQL